MKKKLEKHLFWITASLTADVYKDKYRAKYSGLPVMINLYMCIKVLKTIHCFTGSQ